MSFTSVAKPFLLAIPCIHIMLILFGAPFLYDFVVTLLFSIWLSLLAILPISWSTNGLTVQMLTMFFEQICSNQIQEYLLWSAYGTFLGAWLGAIVIPLDWDRWWQRYPIPCAFGSTFGFLAGLAFAWLRTQLKRPNRNVRNSRKQV